VQVGEDELDEELGARALAAARYRRNHEWMNEVFMYAAFGERSARVCVRRGADSYVRFAGEKSRPRPPPRLSEMFKKDDMEAQMVHHSFLARLGFCMGLMSARSGQTAG
jgi:hypothetical protein